MSEKLGLSLNALLIIREQAAQFGGKNKAALNGVLICKVLEDPCGA